MSRSVHKIFRPGNFAMEYRDSVSPQATTPSPVPFLHPSQVPSSHRHFLKTTWVSDFSHDSNTRLLTRTWVNTFLRGAQILLAISLGGKRWVSVVGALSSICNHYCETNASRSPAISQTDPPTNCKKKCRQCKELPRRRSPSRRAAVQREKISSWAMAAQEDPSLPQTNLKKPIGHSTVYQVRLALSPLSRRSRSTSRWLTRLASAILSNRSLCMSHLRAMKNRVRILT